MMTPGDLKTMGLFQESTPIEELSTINPLFAADQAAVDAPVSQPDPTQDQPDPEPMQIAGLGGAFTKALKRSAAENVIPAIKVSEEASERTEEFVAKHELDIVMPDKAVNINLKYLDAPDKVNQTIADLAEMMPKQVDEARRGVRTHEQTQLLADELGLTVEDLLQRPIGKALNAEEITAARWLLADTRDKVSSLAELISAKQATDEQKAEFRSLFSTYAGIQMQIHGAAAEAGRALNAFKIVAKSGELRKAELENMMQRTGGNIDRLADGFISLDNPMQQAKFARSMGRPGAFRMFLEYWINALLSSPVTHAVNTTSNSVVALAQIPETLMASAFGKIFSGSQGVQSGEAMARMYGLMAGARDGFGIAYQAFKSGEPSDAAQKMDIPDHTAITGANVENALQQGVESLNYILPGKGIDPQSVNLADPVQAGIDAMGTFIRLPGRFLLTEDEYFKAVNYRMELNALAYREGKAQKLSGDALAEFITKVIDNPPESLNMQAIESAKYHTFTNELGTAGRKMVGALNAFPVSRLVVPFFRTPINILKYSAQRVIPPIPFMPSKLKDDLLSGDPARRDMAMGRMSMGAMVWATVVPMVAENYDCEGKDFCITGGPPPDPKMRATLQRTGWQEYSVKIDGEFYSYSRSDPFGQMLGIAADVSRLLPNIGEVEASELATSLVMAISENVVNKTYMSGVAEFTSVFKSHDKEKWLKYMRRLGASTTGSFSGAVEKAVDPIYRVSDDIVGAICAKTPGCSSSLPPVRDLWGRPRGLEIWGGEISQYMALVSPIRKGQSGKAQPIDRELFRLGYAPSRPRKVIDGVELDPKEYDFYVRAAGNKLKAPAGTEIPINNPLKGESDLVDIGGKGAMEALNSIVSNGVYKSLTDGADPPGMKVKTIRAVVDYYRELAKMATLRKHVDLLDSVMESKRADLLATGIDEDEADELTRQGRMGYMDAFDRMDNIIVEEEK